MKLPATAATLPRWAPTVLREALAGADVPRRCPVRKCRRDGACTGPLVDLVDGVGRLAPPDGMPTVSGEVPAPVCYLGVEETVRAEVDEAYLTRLRALVATPGASLAVAPRAIAARRWRRLDGLEG